MIDEDTPLVFPKLGSRWRHTKSGGEYVVMAFCLIEATLIPSVVYKGQRAYYRDGFEWSWWCRPLAEFMDGRFVQIEAIGANDGRDSD